MVGRGLRWLVGGMFCLGAATCGQKGPLELPEEQVAVCEWRSTVRGELFPSRAEQFSSDNAGDDPYDASGRLGSFFVTCGESDGLRA